MGLPVTSVAAGPVQGAGSVVQFSFDDGTTFKKIPGLSKVPRIGAEGSFIDVTDIDETTRSYISGLKTPPEWEMVFKDIAADVDQQLLIDRADAANGGSVICLVTYSTGRTAQFEVKLSGHYADDVELEGVVMHAVKGQISGDIAWGKVA